MTAAYKVFISSEGKILEFRDLSPKVTIAGSLDFDITSNKDIANLYDLKIKKVFRREGFAKKLRSYVITKILKEVSHIYTCPKSTSSEVSNKNLIQFYMTNFKELGAKNIITENSPQLKITASF